MGLDIDPVLRPFEEFKYRGQGSRVLSVPKFSTGFSGLLSTTGCSLLGVLLNS